jgi:hypothetical protein
VMRTRACHMQHRRRHSSGIGSGCDAGAGGIAGAGAGGMRGSGSGTEGVLAYGAACTSAAATSTAHAVCHTRSVLRLFLQAPGPGVLGHSPVLAQVPLAAAAVDNVAA